MKESLNVKLGRRLILSYKGIPHVPHRNRIPHLPAAPPPGVRPPRACPGHLLWPRSPPAVTVRASLHPASALPSPTPVYAPECHIPGSSQCPTGRARCPAHSKSSECFRRNEASCLRTWLITNLGDGRVSPSSLAAGCADLTP